MKRSIKYFLAGMLSCFFLATTISECFSKVVINGKIHHYDGKSIIYYHPTIEGIHTPYWYEILAGPSGVFKIEFENEGFGTTTISFKGLVWRFFHDADSKIYFEIGQEKIEMPKRIGIAAYFVKDSVKQVATTMIKGDFERINKYYNSNIRTSYVTTRSVGGNYYSKTISEINSPKRVLAVLDSLKQKEFDQIGMLDLAIDNEQTHSKNTQADIKKFLMSEVRAFYGSIFLNAMFLKRHDQAIRLIKDSTASREIYNAEWEKLIESFLTQAKENLDPIPGSADYLDYIESIHYTLSDYKQYDFPQNPPPLDQMVVDRLFNYDTLFLPDKKSRFAYTLNGLQRYMLDQLFYSPILLHAVYNLQREYPGSANLAHYEPQINKLKAYIEASGQSFDKGKIVRNNFNTLDELLKNFEGKNLLIDVWATWCHPCVEDFRHKSAVQPFIDSGEIEVLYISIDKPEWEERWRQSIKFNQLQGSHFRADRKFIENMWNVLGDFKGAIPRYALVDKRGKIFLTTASGPGNEGLIKEINALLASSQ